jgi:hypothetical protein
MTEVTNTSERQSSHPIDSDSDAGDIRRNPKRDRTRRRRWYLFGGVIFGVLLLTFAGVLLYARGVCTAVGADSGVSFDLSPVLAHTARPVNVRACVRNSCASITVDKPTSDDLSPFHGPGVWRDWFPRDLEGVVQVNDSLLAWLPVTVRLTVEDQAGNLIFDAIGRVRPHMWQPNGPGCEPTVYSAAVVATRSGRLVPQT